VPRAARPQLRVIGGGLNDTVVRRKRFEVAHPEIVITPPGTQASMWTARRDGETLASGYHLGALLDTLARLLEKQPKAPPSPQEPWPVRHSPSSALSSGSGTAADSSDHTS
jgi:hypothetical protein